MDVILSASSKGGVGKSEIAVQTAYQLSRDGFDVAMMDADIDSSNLSSRMGLDGRVEHDDNDIIKPMEKNGIMVYSMESAFSDSSFSQGGEFMRVVIRSMVNGTDWHDPDYLVVDCPPGTKDIFDELVTILSDDLLGAIVIGQSDTIDDVARMVKVCNHNFVPIIGFVENMSGIYSEGELVKKPNSGQLVAPFGRGKVESLASKIDGRFLGAIPLCDDSNDIEQAATNTIKSIGIAVKDAQSPDVPSLNEGNKSFVKNVLQGLKAAIQTVNEELDVNEIQREYGHPDNPKIIAIELEDAKGSWLLPSKVHITMKDKLTVVRNPEEVYGGISMTSQELKFALERERLIMDSPQALYTDNTIDTAQYGLVEAVQMGKADAWGDDVVNYLSLLDKVFNQVIDETKLQRAAQDV